MVEKTLIENLERSIKHGKTKAALAYLEAIKRRIEIND